mmetsp:Transcript_13133/g.24956  ORF Transcript_13133/g.24956 Transcript_13133/m.24956 type:complete len:121 (+) Transcript_13133:296-658(+)
MTVHKRQIAEQAMGQLTMVAKSYLPLTNQICGVMTQACPMQEEKAISRCDTCKALVKELEYDYTMLGSRSKALTPKKRVWTVLRSVESLSSSQHNVTARNTHGSVLVDALACMEGDLSAR